MKRSDFIHKGQRVVWRATMIIFIVICALTVLIALLNKDPVMGAVMTAINLAIGAVVFAIMKLVKKVTASLDGAPPENLRS